jgi:hypothetical protein
LVHQKEKEKKIEEEAKKRKPEVHKILAVFFTFVGLFGLVISKNK